MKIAWKFRRIKVLWWCDLVACFHPGPTSSHTMLLTCHCNPSLLKLFLALKEEKPHMLFDGALVIWRHWICLDEKNGEQALERTNTHSGLVRNAGPGIRICVLARLQVTAVSEALAGPTEASHALLRMQCVPVHPAVASGTCLSVEVNPCASALPAPLTATSACQWALLLN